MRLGYEDGSRGERGGGGGGREGDTENVRAIRKRRQQRDHEQDKLPDCGLYLVHYTGSYGLQTRQLVRSFQAMHYMQVGMQVCHNRSCAARGRRKQRGSRDNTKQKRRTDRCTSLQRQI